MAYKVMVDVTNTDIKAGVKCDSVLCPIALAMFRVSGCRVSVGSRQVHMFPDTDYERTASLPAEARNWMHDFDRKKAVLPISFELSFEDVA